jgi:SulP family sulfate permease
LKNPANFLFEPIRLCSALRETFAEGYGRQQFFADLLAGVVVACVAIPLSMALAVASGVTPQYGLYTLILAGITVAILGGSRYQITGPTAAFVVLLLPVVQNFGVAGLFVAGLIAGIMLIFFGAMKLGDVIQYVPHPVTTGFTSGIAVVIASLQIKDFLGLNLPHPSSHFVGRLIDLSYALPTLHMNEAATGLTTLILLFACFHSIKKVPAPILALTAVTVGTGLLHYAFPSFTVDTIETRFLGGIPQAAPHWLLPWQVSDSHTAGFTLNMANIQALMPSAFAIAMLGAIESLLSATIADGMTQKRHAPNTELIALGIGNIVCPFFGGIPATGAIARTATNIRFGGVSPISSVIHAIVSLFVIISFAPVMNRVPMSALAALLLFVAYNMAERRHFLNILRIGTIEDKIVLLVCFGLTVIFDMTVGVGVGVVLASLLFIRRVANTTTGQILNQSQAEDGAAAESLPRDVILYKISGAMFFGAANRAMETLRRINQQSRCVILDFSDVEIFDMTAVVALDSAIQRLIVSRQKVFLVVDSPAVRELLDHLQVVEAKNPEVQIFTKTQQAIQASRI